MFLYTYNWLVLSFPTKLFTIQPIDFHHETHVLLSDEMKILYYSVV